ncbi:MAG: hypothetical protein WCT44_01200 [Candidatus Paceibacterota bacterium]
MPEFNMDSKSTEQMKGNEGFVGLTHDVEGLLVNGEKVKALNPDIINGWVENEHLSLADLETRIKEKQDNGEIPRGYRLPKASEIVDIKQNDKQKKFGKITDTAGVSEGEFNFLTDEGNGKGFERSSQWRKVDGASFDEQNEDASSTTKEKLHLQKSDVIFLVKDGNAGTSSNN